MCILSSENFEDEIFISRGELTHPEPRLTYVLVGVAANLRNFHFRVTNGIFGDLGVDFLFGK